MEKEPMLAEVPMNNSRKFPEQWPVWLHCGVVILTVAVAASIRVIGWPVLQTEIPWLLFVPGVMLVAWVGGLIPGLAATVLSALTVDYLLLEPLRSLGVHNYSQAVGYGLFLSTGILISLWVDHARAVQARLRETAHGLVLANEALREGEARLQAIVDGLNEGIVIADLEGHLVGWNRAALAMHQIAHDPIGPRSLEELESFYELSTLDGTVLPPEQWPLARVLRGERLRGWDLRIRRLDTDWERFFSYGGTLAYGEDGRPLIAVVTINDITERKHAEQALRRANEEWERTFDSVPDLIAILDVNYQVVRTNRAMAERLGVTPGATIGTPCYRCVHGAKQPPEGCPHALTLKDGKQHVAEVHEEHLGGHFLVSTTPLHDEQGRMIGSVHVARDITERKRSEERTRFLSEASSILASSLDYDETLQRVAELALPALADVCVIDLVEEDARVRRVTARASDPAQQALVDRLCTDGSSGPCPASISEVIASGKPVFVPEIDAAALAAAARTGRCLEILRQLSLCSFLAVPLVARGRVLGAFSLMMTTSGRRCCEDDLQIAQELGRRAALAIDNAQLYAGERKARAAAEEADRAKDQFVALVSHELRNPLNAIQAGVGLLQHLGTSDPRAARTLEIIGRNVKLQARLVNDLLDLSRIQREKLQFQHAPVEIARMVTAAVQASASEASEAGLSLTSTVIPDLWVHGDFDRLQQVVMNLLSNAIKFTPSGGEIRVHVAQAGNRAQVIVEDTGIGIDLDQIDSLFEVFRQGEVGAQRKPGLGLGLALVKEIVERHGGHVYAESEGPGKGSRFIVDLPLVPSPGVRTPESETPAALPRTIGVLLIEDNPDTRALVADTLSLAGYDVQTAASGEDALKLLREQAHCCLAGQACHPGACSPSRRRPDIILCDIGLPGMDGFEFLRRARELPHMTEVPAFAVTGLGSEEDVRRGQESGFVCHFVKPVDIHAIDARIREWVTAKGDAE